MSERKAFLEKISIKNFLSLRDVALPFKPLTVLVGPNASGKSNTFSALYHLSRMLVDEKVFSNEFTKDTLWAGEARKVSFYLQTKVAKKQTLYHLDVKAKPDFYFHAEQLSVDDTDVISIQDGKGVVRDEIGDKEMPYNSNELALRSAGNYGDKPTTRALAEFIRKWEFYDFMPDFIRGNLIRFSLSEKEIKESPKLDSIGMALPEVLWNWHKNSPESFQSVSNALAYSTHREIDYCNIDGKNQFCLLEGFKNPIPLGGASDGILRLIAYNILLNDPELPPLIAIEEPERNFHPGALADIANVLEQIAQYSQVIITTHNSQLLGAFNPESLGDSLGVLLLRNRPGFGQRCLTLRITAAKRRHLMAGLLISGLGVPSLIVDSCQMKRRI